MPDRLTYRPALRAFYFGLLALLVRIGTMAMFWVATPEEPGFTHTEAWEMVPFFNVTGTVVALIGIAYAAIAAHRREWGVLLVFAWIFSVVGVFGELQPFVYFDF